MLKLNKNFPREVIFLFKFISNKYFNNKSNDLNKLVLHFFKSHFLILLFIRISFYYLNAVSLILYRKKFSNLKFDQFNNLLLKIKKLKFLQSNKITELFYAITTIHLDGEESSNKIKNENQIKEFYENIVIGSGPGGSITANELNKAKKDVLLLEKGNWFKHFNLKHPGEEFFLKWKNGGLAAAIGNVKIQYSSAECFGGGSEINSGLYHEPDEDFLNEWSKKFSTKDMNYNELKKFIDLTKEKTNVSYLKEYSVITEKIINSANINNWKIDEIPRWCSIKDNIFIKKSMTETYLKEYLENKGLVSLDTKVTKIFKKKDLWKIEYIKKEKKKSISCNNIFLCCGSIENLKILKENNFVKKNNKITFHPMIKVIAKFNEKVNTKKMEILTHQLTEFFPDFLIGSAASGLPFLKISSQQNEKIYQDVNKNWENMLIFHSTFSIGEGEVINIPFVKEPIVNFNIKNNELNLIKTGLEKLCKLLIDAECEYIYPIGKKSAKLNSSNYKNYINQIKAVTDLNYSTVHILGGIPMGENRSICKANSYGELYGFKNFYINDSSLICNKLLKNPQGTVMAIALRNVKNFLKYN